MAQQTKVDTLYTVAYQRAVGEAVHVYRIKESNRMELFDFIKRVLEIGSLGDAAFLEVHEELADGKGARVVYGNPKSDWPANVPVVNHSAIMGQKPKYIDPRSENITVIPDKKVETGLVVKELRDKAVALLLPYRVKVA